MIVTIDGPAGTGKSTAARRLAERLGFQFLDTGAMYRVVALRCLEQSANPESDEASGALARSAEITFEDCRTFLGSRDVSQQIRETNVTQAASLVARNPSVRSAMVELQRAFATGRNIVTEGRDQGTVVFPLAELKLYLTADPVERARRRFDELRAQGQSVTLEELLEQQGLRDERDRTRDVAPLRPADDAVVIDTTSLSIEQVLERMLALVATRRSR